LALAASADEPKAMRVAAGTSIAAAVRAAGPGSLIEVEPGIYRESLTVAVPGITLRGLVRGTRRPVLEGGGRLGNGVIVSGSPFSMSGFRVQHYEGSGVTTRGVDGVVLTDLEIDDTGRYGLYLVQSRNIDVAHNVVTGVDDAAICVDESSRVVVAYNDVHDNAAGIQIENTNDTEVHMNLAYDNAVGIMIFSLPDAKQKRGTRTRVHDNWSLHNNEPSVGDPEAIVGRLPHGVGILVMAADDTAVDSNVIKQNDSAGIAILRLVGIHALDDPQLQRFSDSSRIGFNQLVGNGLAPHRDLVEMAGGGADLVWDGRGRGNCADLTDQVTRAGAPLPSCLELGDRMDASPLPVVAAAPHAVVPSGAPPVLQIPSGHLVFIQDMKYEPRHMRVKKGATVTWVNLDGVMHDVTSGAGTTPTYATLASPTLLRGESYSHTFDEPGRYEYLCVPHLALAPMRGATITVEE
jgi:parallel beta-helix repeat protein